MNQEQTKLVSGKCALYLKAMFVIREEQSIGVQHKAQKLPLYHKKLLLIVHHTQESMVHCTPGMFPVVITKTGNYAIVDRLIYCVTEFCVNL